MDNIILQDDTPRKQCKGECQRLLPATTEYFHSAGKGYFHPLCKECRSSTRKEYRQGHREEFLQAYQNRTEAQIEAQRRIQRAVDQRNKEKRHALKEAIQNAHPGERKCTACKQWKPATRKFFYPQSDKKSGWMSHCIECQAKYRTTRKGAMRAWRQANRERLKQYAKQYEAVRGTTVRMLYRERYRERRRELNRSWSEANRERVREKARQYRRRHPDRIKQYQQSHREQSQANFNRRRARLLSIPGAHTSAEIQEQLKRQHYRCYYAACGFAKFKRVKGRYIYHIDHTIPISRSEAGPRNEISHLVLACPSCNLSKHDKLPHEWPEGGRLL